MTDPANLALVAAELARLESIRCRRAGAVAENMARGSRGEAMAYGDDAFDELSREAEAIALHLDTLANRLRSG
jgi:hypothetical protein